MTLIAIWFSYFCLSLELLTFSTNVSEQFHNFCLEILPDNSAHTEIYQALICGSSLQNPLYLQLFQGLGLVHLFVVSGWHLNLIAYFCGKFLSNRKFQYFLTLPLLFYALSCQWRPPVVRALFNYILRTYSQSYYTNSFRTIWLCGNFCLILFPQWWHSLSLQLSWWASLILCLRGSIFIKLSLIFLGLHLLMHPIFNANPFYVLSSLLLTPILSYLLFPLTLLSAIWQNFTPISDSVWNLFIKAAQLIEAQPIVLFNYSALSIPRNWLIIATLNGVLWLSEVYTQRKNWSS